MPPGAKFLEIDLRDPNLPQDEKFDGVIHAAGIKYAGKSVKHLAPRLFLQCIGTWDSRSVASYRGGATTPRVALWPQQIAAEWVINDFAIDHDISYTCLRFFNVVDVGGEGVAGTSPFNLLPNLVRAFQDRTEFELYGADLATPDGTCIRDYILVYDIASGHLAAIAAWERGESLTHAYNLGLSQGISVKAILDEFEKVSGFAIDVRERPQRRGDALAVWASNELVVKALAWVPTDTLEEMATSCL